MKILIPIQDFIAAVLVGIVAFGIIGWCTSGHAKELSESQVIPAILGEAGPEFAERLAIACAIRNRGTLHGVYGHKSDITASEWQKGSQAWNEAKDGPDVVKGADHWLSDWDLKHAKPRLTRFRFKMVETVYIGSTHFYKEIK